MELRNEYMADLLCTTSSSILSLSMLLLSVSNRLRKDLIEDSKGGLLGRELSKP